jgi:hypothetical protein
MHHISFITTIKICDGYEFLLDRINVYILNIQKFCEKYEITYEILICEQIDEKNKFLIGDKIINNTNVKIIPLEQNYYNPFKYNLIESYGKNACLKEANSKFTCMTSADQIFSEEFFVYIKNLKLKTFYRCATFEIPEINVKEIYETPSEIDNILKTVYSQTERTLCNPGCFEDNLSPNKLGQKSGDIMILDTVSFKNIGGWPENECFIHVDTTVCHIIWNNLFNIIVPNQNICTYTMQQTNRNHGTKEKQYIWAINKNGNIEIVDSPIPGSVHIDHESYQYIKACSHSTNNLIRKPHLNKD